MKKQIIIFDTTLRDGEQSPGASLTVREKVEIAKQLERLKVDVMEAGFPVSSPGDYEAVAAVAREVKDAGVCGLARSLKKDIDAAAGALKKARRPCIHVFLGTSKIHMQYKFKKPESEILKIAVDAVKYARNLIDHIEFSPEDAARTERVFLARVVEAVIDAGARTINIPDTVGYTTPDEFGSLIAYLRGTVPNIHKAVISVHCHNDLGLGVANSLSALLHGAGQVECTINGIGERAGNAALEEIVMAIKTRSDVFRDIKTGINTKQIIATSRLVSRLTGIPIQPNKAIVGANAFAHESGIHQDGILKERSTYEIMTPQSVGLKESMLVLGKHSGRHAFRQRLMHLGYTLSDAETDEAFERFKVLADKKKNVFDDDLVAILDEEISKTPVVYELDYVHVGTGSDTVPTATIRLKKQDQVYQDAACGDGPVDAACKAIDRITGRKGTLLDYHLQSITAGKDALGEVTVRVQVGARAVIGKAASTDIIEASTQAYLNAINKIIIWQGQRHDTGPAMKNLPQIKI